MTLIHESLLNNKFILFYIYNFKDYIINRNLNKWLSLEIIIIIIIKFKMIRWFIPDF